MEYSSDFVQCFYYSVFLSNGLDSTVRFPWYLIKILGKPNLVITCSNRKCVVVSALQSLTGAASTYLVRYSITVINYLELVLFTGGLIGSTNSITHFSNTCKSTHGRSGISSLQLGLPTL
jgi:hypothetical protein